MATFTAKWRLEGLEGGPVEAGEQVEAKLDDVKHLVAREHGGEVANAGDAVLEPADSDSSAAVDAADVNLQKLNKTELIAHAADNHELTLDPNLKKDEMVAAIEEARTKAA